MRLRSLIPLCGLAISCFSSGGFWDQLKPADFPARVASIDFPNGKLVRGVPMPIGAWNLQLPANATAGAQFGGYGAVRIVIRGLTCTNKVMGAKPCSLTLSKPQNSYYAGPATSPCAVYMQGGPALPIDCPGNISFEH